MKGNAKFTFPLQVSENKRCTIFFHPSSQTPKFYLSLGLADGHEVKKLSCKTCCTGLALQRFLQAGCFKPCQPLPPDTTAAKVPPACHGSPFWGSGLSSLEPFGGSGRDVGHARLLEECGRPLELIQKLRAGRWLSPSQIRAGSSCLSSKQAVSCHALAVSSATPARKPRQILPL